MRKRPSREISIFNLSMLDVICSALGAFVILFILFSQNSSALQAKADELQSQVVKCEEDNEEDQAAYRECIQERGELEQTLEDCRGKLGDCENQLREEKAEKDKCRQEMSDCRNELGKCKRSFEDCQTTTKECADKIADCDKRLAKCEMAPCETRCPCPDYCCNNEKCPCDQYCAQLPTLFGLPLKADRLVFVVDVSGSMADSVPQRQRLKDTVTSLLDSCEIKEGFRFVFFNSDVHPDPAWTSGTPADKQAAKQRVLAQIDAFLEQGGGTNTNGALLESLTYDETDVIYFITDGTPSAGTTTRIDKILSNVRSANSNNVMINSIMVGLPADRDILDELYEFLHMLAEQNRGVYVGR